MKGAIGIKAPGAAGARIRLLWSEFALAFGLANCLVFSLVRNLNEIALESRLDKLPQLC